MKHKKMKKPKNGHLLLFLFCPNINEREKMRVKWLADFGKTMEFSECKALYDIAAWLQSSI